MLERLETRVFQLENDYRIMLWQLRYNEKSTERNNTLLEHLKSLMSKMTVGTDCVPTSAMTERHKASFRERDVESATSIDTGIASSPEGSPT